MSAQEWEEIFRRQQWGRWADTRFVEWCMRTFGGAEDRSAVKFLELGCGFGAQLRFLWDEGFYAEGMDGSQTAVDFLHTLPDRKGIVVQVDLPADFPEADGGYSYDCIVDVCALQHIPDAALLIQKASRWLKPGGWIFSKHAAHRRDRPHNRPRSDVPEPYLLRYEEITHLYAGFACQVSEEIVTDFGAMETTERRHWIITGRRV